METPPSALGLSQHSTPSIEKTEESSSEGTGKRALHSSKARFWVNLIIISAYVVAVILAIVHHIFLANLHHRDTTRYSTDTRAWVGRANNLLSKIIATSLGAIVATALVQASWNAITSEYIPVSVMDDLFSLPSPVAVGSLLYKYPKLRILPLVGLAILTQALVLVSVLAPSALSIDAYWIDRTSPVPKLDFSKVPDSDEAIQWTTVLPHLVRNDPSENWVVPPECGSSCTFLTTYQAPGISCRQMSEQETGLKPFDSQLLSNTTWWWGYDSRPKEFEWGASEGYLNFSFVPLNAQTTADGTWVSITQTGTVQGQLCKFYDATYRANFTYKDNQKFIGVDVISDTNDISKNCPWTGSGSASQDCTQYASTAAKLGVQYEGIFGGTMSWSSIDYSSSMPDLISQFIDYSFKRTDEGQIVTMAPYSNTSQRVEHRFSTTALGLLLWMNQTETASVKVEVGSSWLFDPLELWVIYGSALLLSLVAGLYGLHLARVGDIVREKKFSSFLIATRTNDLDDVCVQNYDTIMSTKLRHDAETGRFLVSKDETNDPMPHDRAPGQVALDEAPTQAWTRSTMGISLLLALVFALGHHLYLNSLHGKDADKYPQYWIKGASNAFSQAVSICLGTAAAYSLVQASWRALKLHGGSVETIDNLFGLPSPLSAVSLVKKARQIQTVYLILIALAIQGLGLVTTFAPSALTVNDSPPSTSKDLSVPTMNLSVTQYSQTLEYQTWTNLIEEGEAKSPSSQWSVPAGCGAACSFKVQYDAPTLSCRDIQPNESLVAPYNTSASYSESIWRFYDIDDSLFQSVYEWSDNNPEVILSYIPMSFNLDNHSMTSYGSPTGSACRCRDGRYEMEFKYANHAIDLTTTLLPYSNAFPTNCMELDSEVAINTCHIYRNNTVDLCQRSMRQFYGYQGVNVTANTQYSAVWNGLVFQKLFDLNVNWAQDRNIYLRPRFANLSETLPSLLANLTVGLMPALNETAKLSVNVTNYARTWNYEPKELFAAYIPALVAILGIVVYGLYCIHANGRVMDGKFSTLVLTTRSGKLDTVYDKVDNFDELLEEKLVYAKRGCFVPETEEASEIRLKQA
ncbi:hypothetical protein CPB86DRAFT_829976 [Serendipita vermifera]|nr:hypothetical protein CPB86DRAFT_829976 [Serendipita vermifera]